MSELVACTENVFGVLVDIVTGHVRVIKGRNIISNDGDLYYAQRAVVATLTDDFTVGGLRLGSGTTAPAKADTDVTTFLTGTGLVEDSGFPQVNNTDNNNAGGAVDHVTWRFSYGTGEANSTGIIEGAIVDDITTPTACLCHFLFAASFNKTSASTLTIYINHNFLGL